MTRTIDETGAETCEWTVTGMDCASCAGKIRAAVERLPGVEAVEVALMTERLRLRLTPGQTPPARIEETVRALGYGIGAHPGRKPFVLPGAGDGARDRHDPAGHDHAGDDHAGDGHVGDGGAAAAPAWHRSRKGRLVLVSGAVLALAWGAAALAPGAAPWAFALACLIGLGPIARRALAALRTGQPFTIEALMTVAALGALLLGAAEEAAVVVFLFAVGEVLEGVAAGRARAGIRALRALVPTRAWREGPGGLTEVAADSLLPGQIVLVRPGDRLPADGEIVSGQGGIDESPVTGESLPVTRGPGEAVFAGAINTEAALRIRVTRAADDNTIARIVRLVEEAETARAPTERFIDRFSRWYMPVIVGLAALVAVVPPLAFGLPWGTWAYRGLALLLIGCPCALVISVPAAMAAALSAGARRGLLMKGGAVVEAVAGVGQVAFDKTGTLTRGRPEVTDIAPLEAPADTVLALAAGIEAGSSHPLARAIRDRAAAAGLVPQAVTAITARPGQGMQGQDAAGRMVAVLSPEAAGVAARATIATLEAAGKTMVAVVEAGRVLGLIALRDEPRPEAATALAQLRALGLGTVMLTGDNPRTAAAIAGGLGIDWRAGLLPADKLGAVAGLGADVMMVGDGINDAPALKAARVGVAMGSGTGVALETADAAILRDRLTDLPATIRLARATMATVRQNIALALGLKAVFLVTTVAGLTGLWPAILADTGATVLVTLNALRLLSFDPARAG